MKGPDAEKFLEGLCINSFKKFPIGSMKHAVMCTQAGLIAAHGIVERKAEDHFELFASFPWPLVRLEGTSCEVEAKMRDDYLFQIAGPNSLKTLEKVTGESLRNIRFLRFRDSKIEGTKVEVGRIGMTGNLRAAWTDRGRPEDLRCRFSSGPGVRHRASGMGNLSRQSRRRRVPADHRDVHPRGNAR